MEDGASTLWMGKREHEVGGSGGGGPGEEEDRRLAGFAVVARLSGAHLRLILLLAELATLLLGMGDFSFFLLNHF